MKIVVPSEYVRSGIIGSWSALGLVDLVWHIDSSKPATAYRSWKPIESKMPFIWWNKVGDVLLYHFPTLQRLPESVKYRVGLFGNPTPPLNGRINSPWIFWPRNYGVIEKYRAVKSLRYDQRKFNCAFIGGYENVIQRGHRCFHYWRAACDLFEVSGSRKTPTTNFTAGEYARMMRQSKFGLCLRGYGEKCQREIECFALGTVPIFTPGVSLGYFNKLKLGTHYLMANSVEQVQEIIATCSAAQWEFMSRSGREWYEQNCSPIGSFNTTKQIIEGLNG